jgi:phage baseplate assembly protein W
MAYNEQKIPKIDLSKNKGIGISVDYSNSSIFNRTFTTKDSVKNNLINFLLTEPGERYLNTNFGGGISKYIFEDINNNTLEDIRDEITSKIINFFPNIEISELNILSNPNQSNSIIINLKFKIIDTIIEEEINIIVEND